MVDWNGLAAEKYAILNKNAETARIGAEANANLANTRAAVMPFEVNSQIGLNKAHADQIGMMTSLAPTTAFGEMRYRDALGQQALANARHDDVVSGLLPGQIADQSNYQQAQTSQLNANTNALVGQNSWLDSPAHSFLTEMLRARYPASAPSAGPATTVSTAKKGTGFKSGTEKVPGKGDGTVDTVDAKLAPGEAVLNRAAAEHLGRDVISALNEAGAMVMGLDPHTGAKLGEDAYATNKGGSKEKGENQKTLGYAKGTAKVPGKGAAKKGGGMPPASGSKKGGKAPAAPAPNDMHKAAAGGLLQALARYGRQKAMGSAA